MSRIFQDKRCMCISFCVWGRLSAASLLRGGGGRQKQDLQDEQDLQDKERLRAGALNLQLLRGVVIENGGEVVRILPARVWEKDVLFRKGGFVHLPLVAENYETRP